MRSAIVMDWSERVFPPVLGAVNHAGGWRPAFFGAGDRGIFRVDTRKACGTPDAAVFSSSA